MLPYFWPLACRRWSLQAAAATQEEAAAATTRAGASAGQGSSTTRRTNVFLSNIFGAHCMCLVPLRASCDPLVRGTGGHFVWHVSQDDAADDEDGEQFCPDLDWDRQRGMRYTRTTAKLHCFVPRSFCNQCRGNTWVNVCISDYCQEHHTNRYWQERGYQTSGRRYRGRKSEQARARWGSAEILHLNVLRMNIRRNPFYLLV